MTGEDHAGLDLRDLVDERVPATWKGVPARAVGRPLHALRTLNLSLRAGDVPLPAAVLRRSALAHNAQWMRDFANRNGASLCPHGKTTMAPQLFDLQLRFGAWGITAATPVQARICHGFGVRRLLLANQVVDRGGLDIVFALVEDEGLDLYLLVDSLAGLAALVDAARTRRLARPVQVLLEVGGDGGRTGARSVDDAEALAAAIAHAPEVTLRGVEAFEGVYGARGDASADDAVRALLARLVAVCRAGIEGRWFADGEIIVSAGGSAHFDIVTRALRALPDETRIRRVLRSGCYLSHDALHYAHVRPDDPSCRAPQDGLRNAIEVWAAVQSIPERERALCNLGKRDASHDLGLPQPLRWFRPGVHTTPQPAPQRLRTSALNDQHAYLDGPDVATLRAGDLIVFGIAHPCTTFDKWPLLLVADDDDRVVDGVRTFF